VVGIGEAEELIHHDQIAWVPAEEGQDGRWSALPVFRRAAKLGNPDGNPPATARRPGNR